MKLVLSALLFAASLATSLHAAEVTADTHAADHAQIQQLVERFKGAIIAKDGDAMRAMFLSGASWLQGTDKASLAKERIKQPDAQQFTPWSHEQFAKFVSTAPTAIEETFDNVRIETDGIIGTVIFDYQFLTDHKTTNHGVETWQLVHTDEGWKISAMLYSLLPEDIH